MNGSDLSMMLIGGTGFALLLPLMIAVSRSPKLLQFSTLVLPALAAGVLLAAPASADAVAAAVAAATLWIGALACAIASFFTRNPPHS